MPDEDSPLAEFLVESYENLDSVDGDLLALEDGDDDPDLLARVFRIIHTIKGTCGFFGFTKLEATTHAGENLLDKLRDRTLAVSPAIASALLELVDAVRGILGEIERNGSEGEAEYSELIRKLEVLQDPGALKESTRAAGDEAAGVSPVAREDAGAKPASGDAPSADAPPKPEPKAPAGGDGGAPSDGRKVVEGSIRVGVNLLDRLMNLVGELVLSRNQILQHEAVGQDGSFQKTAQRLNLITTELQEGVMQTRMQPIGTIWDKFPRVVRDLAVSCHKRVRVEMEGRETELDRTLVDAIKDPLTHIVRNSVDHGIESPDVREAAGKDPEGRLFLRAYHEGGQVNIEISDDGGGVDLEKLKRKALERGLSTPDQLARMTDREVVLLVFHPGLSTADKVTNVSGRGVGMDVVKSNIEKIGGVVDLKSSPGQGTTIRVKIPLTLAIIPALLVSCAGETYAIPQVSLLELVRVDTESQAGGIEMAHGAPVYRLRGRLLPLVFLDRALGRRAEAEETSGGSAHELSIVVLQAGEHQFGLVVDDINDTQEIVVKPLGKQIKQLDCFAGATILGDGRVALILDVLGLALSSKVMRDSGGRHCAEGDAQARSAGGNRESLLLFSVGAGSRMAVPLAKVTRLEEFPRSAIERAGDRAVAQYRGRILPLLDLPALLEAGSKLEDADTIQVVVYSEAAGQFGLVVHEIIDVVEAVFAVEQRSDKRGVLGSAIVEDCVTDLIDPHTVIAEFDAGLVGHAEEEAT